MRFAARSGHALLATTVSACSIGIGPCDREHSVPRRLADGTTARLSSVAFEGIAAPVIATQLRPARTALSPCARGSRTVDRVGIVGASRTSVSHSAREARACDWTPSSGWCGHAFARLRDGAPTDARLSITCHDGAGEPLGFVWVTPASGAAYVVVTGRGYAEAYPVVRGAPVRLTTDRAELATSSATVELTEHAADGRLLRARHVEAQVSG